MHQGTGDLIDKFSFCNSFFWSSHERNWLDGLRCFDISPRSLSNKSQLMGCHICSAADSAASIHPSRTIKIIYAMQFQGWLTVCIFMQSLKRIGVLVGWKLFKYFWCDPNIAKVFFLFFYSMISQHCELAFDPSGYSLQRQWAVACTFEAFLLLMVGGKKNVRSPWSQEGLICWWAPGPDSKVKLSDRVLGGQRQKDRSCDSLIARSSF